MGPRVYFYKDSNGITKRNVYCSMCGAGPFKEEDTESYKKSGGDRTALCYCKACLFALGVNELGSQRWAQGMPGLEKNEEESPDTILPVADAPQETVISDESSNKPAPVCNLDNFDTERDECSELLRKELRREKAIPTKGLFKIYIGEYVDGAFTCGVARNLKDEIKRLNKKQNGSGKLPAEIVYYRAEKDERKANIVREILTKYKRDQKERLIEVFGEQFFKQ